jgi:DNA-binding LacI/PurR family transcriptional regulator
MPEDPKAPTIREVARLAGVSTASVSRVLNKKEPITGDLYARVTRAIQELGYKPQRNRTRPTAQQPWLVTLVENIEDPFFLQVLTGVQEQAEDDGYYPVILTTTEKRSRQAQILAQLKYQQLVGIIAAGLYLNPEEWAAYQREIGVPIVVMNTHINHPRIASVMVDFETAAFQATQHLLSLNHTRIAFMGNYDYDFAEIQLRGVRRALQMRGLEYPDEYRFSIPHTPEGASQGVSKMMLLPLERRPTALFTFDDLLAIQVLNSIRYYGLRIPEDISVMGFDNIPMSMHSNPPLTTVDVPKRRIGRLMVNLINQLTDKEEEGLGATIIEGSLIMRSSTGPAPKE